jgi:hypothetical protein
MRGHGGGNEVSAIELIRYMVGAGGRTAVYQTAGPRGAHRAAEGGTVQSPQ